MPSNRTRRTRARSNAIDHWKLDQLFTGQCLIAGVGYAAGTPYGCNYFTPADKARIREDMRRDWALWGADIMAWWRGEHDRYTDQFTSREKLRAWLGNRKHAKPYAAREFGEPQ